MLFDMCCSVSGVVSMIIKIGTHSQSSKDPPRFISVSGINIKNFRIFCAVHRVVELLDQLPVAAVAVLC
jgi:hypothetical protein